MRPTLQLVALVISAALAAGAHQAAAAPEPAITLTEAVARTLRHDPAIRQAREVVAERRAALREASGTFDMTQMLDGHFAFDRQELYGNRWQSERNRRLRFEIASVALDRAADSIMSRLPTAGSLLLDECQLGQTEVVLYTPDDTRIIVCLNSDGNFGGLIFPGAAYSGAQLTAILRSLKALDSVIDDLQQDYLEYFSDLMRILARQLRLAASALRIGRERLGPMPDEEQFLELDLVVGYQFRFRNGAALTSSLSFNGTEDNYAGKPLHPLFGDSLFPNAFTSALGMTLDVPLGKGRGRVAAAAPERAAEASLQAAEALYAHTAAERALATVGAYWQLAAAQERLRLYERSAATQEEILDNTRELVEADELVAADLERTRAQVAAVDGEVAGARRDLVTARLALVEAMGVGASHLDQAPLAADALPDGDGAADFDPEDLVREAYAQRRDLAAARETVRAGTILTRAAEVNRRHQLDLSFSLSFNGLYESYSDRIYDFEGYYRALTGEVAGPSYGIKLRWGFPIGNNTARGRLVQAEASLARSEIVAADLRRLIRLRIRELAASHQRARAELQELRETLANLEKTLESSLELYRAGELTLIDTLLTEEQLTDARLAVVGLKSEIADLEAQLRFESGRLLAAEEAEAYDPIRARLALATAPAAP